jgi:hypothetical protein
MNTVNDTCKLDHRELTDTELDVVTGGTAPTPVRRQRF